MTAVAILHYNRLDLTADCVRSLEGQTLAPSRVLVVDNASDAHAPDALRAALPAFADVLRLDSPAGFAGGMNAAIRELLRDPAVDAVLLLNNDTQCPPPLLERLHAALDADPAAGIVGCAMEGAGGGASQSAAYRLAGFFALPTPTSPDSSPDYLQGSCLLVRRAVFESVGLLDESFFFFGEDADFCLRAVRAGWKLVVAPDATLRHYGSATIGAASERQAAWYRAGTRLLLSKWRSLPLLRALPPFAFRLAADLLRGRFAAVRGSVHGFLHPNLAADLRLRTPAADGATVAVDALFLVPGQVGGSETYLRETLPAMAEAAPRHRFLVFTNHENHDALLADLSRFPNVHLIPTGIRASSKLARLRGEWRVVPHLARRYGADVLWCPGNFAPFSCACPVATSILDMQYRHFPEDYSLPQLWMMRLFTALSVRRSDRILTISEFSRDEIAHFFPETCGRIAVTPLAVSPAFSATPATPATSATSATPATILCVANTYPHKHVEDAVRIFAKVANDVPGLTLELVGQPRRGEAAVRKSVDALPEGLRNRVRRIHRVPFPELVRKIRSCAVFLFPSRYEGFGLPVLEALKAGAPVVACRAGSVPEVGGAHVRYFEPGDIDGAAGLVETVLRNPPDAAALAAARRHADAFTWRRTAERTLSALLPRLRVTVVTPCFNAAATLPALLDSIDEQARDAARGLFDLEHIVMDGGSTDGTRELLASRSRPWRTAVSEKDRGPADAINKGFARAKGEYVAWLNADDAYAPGALARAVAALERHPRASFAFGRCPIVDAADREIRRPITRFKELFFPFHRRWVLQTLNFVSQPATLFRRTALDAASPDSGALRIDFKAAWDYDLLLRLLRQGPCIRIPGRGPVAFFRWTPGSISGSNFRRQFDEELSLALADAGRFSLPGILHRAVRRGVVAIYTAMAAHRETAK